MKQFFAIFLILYSLGAFSQYYNYSFESWYNAGEYYNPNYWDTSNETFMVGTYTPVTKETANPFYGNACVKLKSTYVIGTSVLTGLITLGDFEVNTFDQTAIVKGGKPYTGKPEKLTFFYKYSPAQSDRCGFIIEFYKFNSITKVRTKIADGLYYSYGAADWTYVETPITYYSTDTPDSMNIIILSSDTANIISGSTLWVDNIALQGGTEGIEENNNDPKVTLYVDYGESEIVLSDFSGSFNENEFKVINCFGQVMDSGVFQKSTTINVLGFSNGLYTVLIKSEKGTIIRKVLL